MLFPNKQQFYYSEAVTLSAGSAATNPDLTKAAAGAVIKPPEGPAVQDKGIEVDDFSTASSTTHLAEWKKFMRKVNSCSERKFPAELHSKFAEDRTQLFQDWLRHGGFARVLVHYRRKTTSFVS